MISVSLGMGDIAEAMKSALLKNNNFYIRASLYSHNTAVLIFLL